jgi:PadR family transcriptional regulator
LTGDIVAKTDLLQGTLDLLLLRILALGPNHGWGISNRIRQTSGDGIHASQGSLYPALHRLELAGEVRSEMKASENNRRARVYTITAAGRRRLAAEQKSWEHFALSMQRVLEAE